MSTDQPDKLAVAALKARVQKPNAALVVAADFLESSARQLNAGFDNYDDPNHTSNFLLATAYGAVAFLLHELHANDQGAASDAAWELSEMTEAGQPLADWVSDQLAALGIDAGALGRSAS